MEALLLSVEITNKQHPYAVQSRTITQEQKML